MNTREFLTGVKIICQYYNDLDGYHHIPEHDMFCLRKTDREIGYDEVKKLMGLGWFQNNPYETNPETDPEKYDPDEDWYCNA